MDMAKCCGIESYITNKYMKKDPITENCLVLKNISFPRIFKYLSCLKFDPNGDTMAIGYRSGDLQEINVSTGQLLWTVIGKNNNIRCLKYCSRAPYIFSCDRFGRIYIHTRTGRGSYRFELDQKYTISSFDLDLSDKNLFCGELCGAIRVIELPSGTVIRNFKSKPLHINESRYHNMQISTVVSIPHHIDIFMTAALDSLVKLWDIRTPSGWVRDIRGPYITGDALDIMGEKILTGSFRQTDCLQLWDMRNFKLIDTINTLNQPDCRYGEYVECCKLFKGGSSETYILSGGSTMSYLNVIDPVRHRIIGQFKTQHPMKIKSIDTYERLIAHGGTENVVIIGKYEEE